MLYLSHKNYTKFLKSKGCALESLPLRGFRGLQKRKGPRTWAPFTSHHPLPPKRSFNEKLIDTGQLARYVCKPQPVNSAL